MEKIGVGYAYVSDAEKRYVNEAFGRRTAFARKDGS